MRALFFALALMLGGFFSPITYAKPTPINDIAVLKNGSILLATARGLERQDATRTFLQTTLQEQGMAERLIRVVKQTDQALLLGTNNGVYVQQNDQLRVYLPDLIVFDLLPRSDNSFLVATSQGVADINLANGVASWFKQKIRDGSI